LVEGLGKRYPDAATWALQDLTFEVRTGSAFGVVGANGSGKSTLLDLLMGATRPTAGRLRVEGATASLLELGAGFFVELSGRQNAVHAGMLAGLDSEAARDLARAAEEFAELGDLFHRPVRTYSAGMVMRLGFAVATSLPAPVVLVDEVLAVGDAYFQRKCVDRLLKMRDDGATLVLASHDLHAVKSLCDRALWLDQGRARALGPAADVVGAYEEDVRRRTVTGGGPAVGRRGTGEVVIRDVRLKDVSGRERREFATGESLRVEVLFETTRPLDSPVMGVALFRDDGVYCYGPNSRLDRRLDGTYDGRYLLSAEFEDLPLLAGAYEASVAFYDRDHVYAYAWDHRMYPFRVVGESDEHGLVRLRHRFQVTRVER
jgi:ABC-type polysaccharide/polyol phosphate transport system ATPase subunit